MTKLDVDFRRDFIEALNNIVRRLGQGAKICDCNVLVIFRKSLM
jgi:hypothetical protein